MLSSRGETWPHWTGRRRTSILRIVPRPIVIWPSVIEAIRVIWMSVIWVVGSAMRSVPHRRLFIGAFPLPVYLYAFSLAFLVLPFAQVARLDPLEVSPRV
jgi:hypothetical protein